MEGIRTKDQEISFLKVEWMKKQPVTCQLLFRGSVKLMQCCFFQHMDLGVNTLTENN